jgi:hypothetical protein
MKSTAATFTGRLPGCTCVRAAGGRVPDGMGAALATLAVLADPATAAVSSQPRQPVAIR